MQMRHVVLALSLAVAASCEAAAQPTVIVLSTEATIGSELPRDCQEQVKILRQAWDEQQSGNWTYLVACDDQAWHNALAYGAAFRIQGPTLGYTVFRLQLIHTGDLQAQTWRFGRGPVLRFIERFGKSSERRKP